ncbi:hypothetical protein ABZ744_20275 [Micromonospora chersina]|uniref:hypothetical protein n=1 Tax=Micromonospora chersina TaxID=47854 RepID=UPI0033E46E91
MLPPVPPKAAGAKGPKRPVTRGQKIAAGFLGIALLCCCGTGIAAFTNSGDDKPAGKASPTAVHALAEPTVSSSPSLTPTTSKPSPTPTSGKPSPTPKPTPQADPDQPQACADTHQCVCHRRDFRLVEAINCRRGGRLAE